MSKLKGVDIGFAERSDIWRLESRLFPSKIGGKPAWLDLHNVPSAADLQCPTCDSVMTFLCQVYAPYEEDDQNFHRTLFVFVCKTPTCCTNNSSNNLKVFRSHLERINEFYPPEPPKEEPDFNFNISKWAKLCNLCGCLAEKHCAKCKKAYYCCRDHQKVDWCVHKSACESNSCESNSKVLFSEFELVIEGEDLNESDVNEEREMEKFKVLEAEGKLGAMAHVDESELDAYSGIVDDEVFLKFKERVGHEPEQVLRYERGGAPLFISNECGPVVPNCEYCSSPRQFEFQIMPQMLVALNENDLDWGVLIVYSCRNSCTQSLGYKKEFIYKQDVSARIE